MYFTFQKNLFLLTRTAVVVVGAPGRPTGFTPYPAKDSLFGLFLEQAESWYTGYRAISS